MPNKSKPIPHIAAKFEDAVSAFLAVKPPKRKKVRRGKGKKVGSTNR
jgi:hypothetical protein